MRLFVPLTKTEFDALRDLAHSERRRPQEQAAALIATALAIDPPTPRSHQDAPPTQTPHESEGHDRVSA